MDGTVQINIRVRKYLWSEFVHDVCYVLYATIMISNALCKRYFKLSIPQLYHRIVDPVARFVDIVGEFIKKVLLAIFIIIIGIIALAYSVLAIAGALGYL
jgi:hypothetical protein